MRNASSAGVRYACNMDKHIPSSPLREKEGEREREREIKGERGRGREGEREK